MQFLVLWSYWTSSSWIATFISFFTMTSTKSWCVLPANVTAWCVCHGNSWNIQCMRLMLVVRSISSHQLFLMSAGLPHKRGTPLNLHLCVILVISAAVLIRFSISLLQILLTSCLSCAISAILFMIALSSVVSPLPTKWPMVSLNRFLCGLKRYGFHFLAACCIMQA